MIPFLDLKAINAQYRDELVDACTRVIESGWYIGGSELEQFEQHTGGEVGDNGYAQRGGFIFCTGNAGEAEAEGQQDGTAAVHCRVSSDRVCLLVDLRASGAVRRRPILARLCRAGTP